MGPHSHARLVRRTSATTRLCTRRGVPHTVRRSWVGKRHRVVNEWAWPRDSRMYVASYQARLLPPPRAHAPQLLIMRRWFFGGRRPGRFHHVMRATTLRRMTFSYHFIQWVWFRTIAEYGDIDVTVLSNVMVRRSMTCRATHHVMKSTRPSPPKNHLRIINSCGACARGGGRRPGYEAICMYVCMWPWPRAFTRV